MLNEISNGQLKKKDQYVRGSSLCEAQSIRFLVTTTLAVSRLFLKSFVVIMGLFSEVLGKLYATLVHSFFFLSRPGLFAVILSP